MANLSEELNRIITILEDSVEENNWVDVERCIELLDDIHKELDRQENRFNYDYD